MKITDFGVSAVLTSSMGLRNSFVGTYKYMSVGLYANEGSESSSYFFHHTETSCSFPCCVQPERVSGNTHSYDSDVWSLGLVILECALGHFPYVPPLVEEKWLNFYELCDAIVGQPAPFAAPDRFSPEFCTFISCW